MMEGLASTILNPGLLGNQVEEFLFGSMCLILIVVLFIIDILIMIWIYKDAESRGMSGVTWLVLLLVGGIFGFWWIILIVYLVIRKPKLMAPPAYPMAPPPGYGAVPPPAYGAPPPGYGAPPPGYGAPPPPPGAQGMNCRYCGTPVPPGSMVCPRCGGRL